MFAVEKVLNTINAKIGYSLRVSDVPKWHDSDTFTHVRIHHEHYTHQLHMHHYGHCTMEACAKTKSKDLSLQDATVGVGVQSIWLSSVPHSSTCAWRQQNWCLRSVIAESESYWMQLFSPLVHHIVKIQINVRLEYGQFHLNQSSVISKHCQSYLICCPVL